MGLDYKISNSHLGYCYEQFVRAVISRECSIPFKTIESKKMAGMAPKTSHQIDLYWEQQIGMFQYKNICECKYRTTSTIDREIAENLKNVRNEIRVDKAIIVTNNSFDESTKDYATFWNIDLWIARPKFDFLPFVSSLIDFSRREIAAIFYKKILSKEKTYYLYKVIYTILFLIITSIQLISLFIVEVYFILISLVKKIINYHRFR